MPTSFAGESVCSLCVYAIVRANLPRLSLPACTVSPEPTTLCSLNSLPEPVKFLERLPSLLVPGGIVVLISPYSWLTSYTSKDKWLGGCTGPDGKVKDSFMGLTAVMERLGFTLVHQEDTPFIIREHIRKYQWGISHGTVWQYRK